MARPTLWTVEELESHIALMARLRPGARLPAVPDLTRRFGVGTRRILEALARLRDQGVLTYRRGQAIACARPPGMPAPDLPAPLPGPEAAVRSDERLYLRLREDILSGKYRTGHVLPKLASLTLESRVSNHTASRAYGRLEAEGLARREGKRWLVGKAVPGRPSPQGPVLLLAQPEPLSWLKLKTQRTDRFLYGFSAEMEANGVRILSFTSPANGAEYESALGDLGRQVKELGDRYRGALVIGPSGRYADLPRLVRSLLALPGPVAWLDQGSEYDPSWRLPAKAFAPCRFSESRLVRTALAHLRDHGHLRAGFIGISHGAPAWQKQRLAQLKAQAAAWGMEVVDPEACMPGFYGAAAEALVECLRRARAGGGRGAKVVEHLLRHVPPGHPGKGLERVANYIRSWEAETGRHPEPLRFLFESLPLLFREDITAFVFANDWTAHLLHPRYAAMGLSIPKELSLLSFDNYLEYAHVPVNTVDIGAGHLGYAAFHFLFGSIPVRRDRIGAIEAMPQVVDRGSAGPPKQVGPGANHQ